MILMICGKFFNNVEVLNEIFDKFYMPQLFLPSCLDSLRFYVKLLTVGDIPKLSKVDD